MKTRRILVILVIVLLVGMVVSWFDMARNRKVESCFRRFVTTLASGDQAKAYALTSEAFRKTHTMDDFIGGPWCNPSNVVNGTVVQRSGLYQVYVRGMNPFSQSVTVIASSAVFVLPFWMEDGFVAVIAQMKQENGHWIVDGDVDTAMR